MNLYGPYTLFKKEILRFIKVYNQTLIAPMVNSLLFLAIFMLAIGERIHSIGGVEFGVFMSSGLIVMVMVQNSFANSSSSFTMGKVLGYITDILIPPLSPLGIAISIVAAAVVRGVLVGVFTAIAIKFFVPIEIQHISYIIFYAILANFLLGALGLLCGIYAQSFDQMSAITSYIITPLSFLSGTFYSVKNLPEFWYNISQYNPFFYMIDGIRYGMTGYHDGDLVFGMIYLSLWVIVSFSLSVFILHKGYRIRA